LDLGDVCTTAGDIMDDGVGKPYVVGAYCGDYNFHGDLVSGSVAMVY
jgi:hypothetical protein